MLRLSSYDNYTHDLYGSRSRRKGTANSIPSNREVLIRDGTLIGRVQYELNEWNVDSSNSSHGLSNANSETITTVTSCNPGSSQGTRGKQTTDTTSGNHPDKSNGIIKTIEVSVR